MRRKCTTVTLKCNLYYKYIVQMWITDAYILFYYNGNVGAFMQPRGFFPRIQIAEYKIE
jgi:hypothetical protein